MTTLKRNSSGLMKRLRKSGRLLVLTVNGKAEAAVLDAASYQEVAGSLEAIAAIRCGLAEAAKGMGRPADEVFADLHAEAAAEE